MHSRLTLHIAGLTVLAVAALVGADQAPAVNPLGNAPDVVGYLDAFLVLFGLYLFVVLVILPGNPHENRYGAVPRPD